MSGPLWHHPSHLGHLRARGVADRRLHKTRQAKAAAGAGVNVDPLPRSSTSCILTPFPASPSYLHAAAAVYAKTHISFGMLRMACLAIYHAEY